MAKIHAVLSTVIALVASVTACVTSAARTDAPVYRTAWVSTYTQGNNSPPGAGIEYAKSYGYPTVHNLAGGTGTYSNPVTFASPLSQWKPGTRSYIPFFHMYFIKEDWCATCGTSVWRLDLWAGKASGGSPIANFWRQLRIQVSPPKGLPVDTTPLSEWTPRG